MDVLPASGLVRVMELAEFLHTDENTLGDKLEKMNAEVIKISKYKATWLVRLESIKGKGK